MREIINDFKKQFYKIRDMGYVKSINNYTSGIGLTFENLIGKKVDNYPMPDYKGRLEIKTKLAYSKIPIHLFKLTPDGQNFYESQSILEKYGYYKNNKTIKAFNGSVFANELNKIGLNNYFSLDVNYKEEMVKLLVYDLDGTLVDDSTYWQFEKIENALTRKLKYLVLIQAWSTQREKTYYYKYYRYDLYKLSNFYTFLNLLDRGIISIGFSLETTLNKNRTEQIHDHGTSFDINKEDLEKLYYKIDI